MIPEAAQSPTGVVVRLAVRNDPERLLARSVDGLGSLDPARPLHGLPVNRWRGLLADCNWLLNAFARSALHDGYTVGELFGLWVWHGGNGLAIRDGHGGIADRLRGSRSLVLSSDRAMWRTVDGEPESFARGQFHNLRPLWETVE